MRRQDVASIEIPTTLLVWVIVLAFSLPPIVGAVGSIEKGRAARTLEAEAGILGRVVERAYSVGLPGNVFTISLQLPTGRLAAMEYLAVGTGSGFQRTLIEWKLVGAPAQFVTTQPEVLMTGPGCAPFPMGSGPHDLVVEFFAAAPPGCSAFAGAPFVMVSAADGE